MKNELQIQPMARRIIDDIGRENFLLMLIGAMDTELAKSKSRGRMERQSRTWSFNVFRGLEGHFGPGIKANLIYEVRKGLVRAKLTGKSWYATEEKIAFASMPVSVFDAITPHETLACDIMDNSVFHGKKIIDKVQTKTKWTYKFKMKKRKAFLSETLQIRLLWNSLVREEKCCPQDKKGKNHMSKSSRKRYDVTITPMTVKDTVNKVGTRKITGRATYEALTGRTFERTFMAQGRVANEVADYLKIGEPVKLKLIFSNMPSDEEGKQGASYLTIAGLPDVEEARKAA